ncbi:hypothetical protein DMN91_007662 [Ooceraea biroi]|uniref:CHK kinase-like domain-containing protein n=1 Tax=Ooceraea biroi TaxID=2015173 RepID=A0A026W789_OOCBI|nr:uncharacterized protein LOC105282416 [Ooceraea biroi]XP_019888203.1 uncharacterized protein LOC105282416 [Ooceraea biroi]XP_026827104.1 uncharacterized protein LOC105282416 [Ooceraea biroi]EZA51972.1 hypothetical protein X777_09287 [Ooceraea biroi]RLU21046.1 hypothetical protein DMN91_007662 [Ooceraea biroi]
MALGTPTWLNLCLLEKILRKSEGDNSIQVMDIISKPATCKGDNYTSDMTRVIVEYKRDQGDHKIIDKKSLIVKVAPTTEGMRKDLVLKSDIFTTEIMMMTDTLDKMNKLLGPNYILNGKGMYVQKEDPMFLVIEDLAPLDFRMACRLNGLDMDHCILALHGLARFHASSIAVCEKEPNQKQMYSRGMFNDQHPAEMGGFFIMGTKGLAAEVEKWPELGKKYSDKILKLADHIYQIGIEACKYCEDDFNVINHGDFWVNNMLFKYDNGKPTKHIFVDFQLCVYTSPAVDLHYFLNTSPSPDIFDNKDILLKEYHNTLSKTMKQLNCKTQPPTMEQLMNVMKKRERYGMISSFTVLPLMLSSKNEAKDIDEIMSKDGSYENPGYKSEAYRKIITKRIIMYDKMGLLDL